MIEPRDVTKRASKLFYDIKRRSEPKYWKNGRLAGRVRHPGVPVPYMSESFASWLLAKIGCNAFLCPYCNAPLDVFSMTLDHDVPLGAGGTNETDNLVPCCSDCNTLKGKMTGEQYLLFRRLMRQLHPAAEADVLQRLRSGAMGMRLSQQMRAQKSKQKPSVVMADEPF